MKSELKAKLDQALRILTEIWDDLDADQQDGIPALPGKRVNLADKGWFTMREAMAWTGLGRKYLSEKMSQRRLWYQRLPGGRGGYGSIRIPKAHLDEQIVRGFPVLDMPRSITEIEHVTHGRPLARLIPGPKVDEDNLPPPRVK